MMRNNQANIAILGGAFDPIHLHHIRIAEFVLENSDSDYVWLTPCYKHMYNKNMESFDHRFRMCILASGYNPRIMVSNSEKCLETDGSTYSLVKSLKENLPMYNFSFIIGMDNAISFNKWYNYEALKEMARFIVIPRKGYEYSGEEWFTRSPHTILDKGKGFNDSDDSSTEIRKLLKKNANDKKLDVFLNSEVKKYIVENKLYD